MNIVHQSPIRTLRDILVLEVFAFKNFWTSFSQQEYANISSLTHLITFHL